IAGSVHSDAALSKRSRTTCGSVRFLVNSCFFFVSSPIIVLVLVVVLVLEKGANKGLSNPTNPHVAKRWDLCDEWDLWDKYVRGRGRRRVRGPLWNRTRHYPSR